MISIDTSVWIDYFKGNPRIKTKIYELLDQDLVALSMPVWIELLCGASKQDLQNLRVVLSALPRFSPEETNWLLIENWIIEARNKGQRFGFSDLLIASIVQQEEQQLWTLDRDFFRMSQFGWIQLYKYTPSV